MCEGIGPDVMMVRGVKVAGDKSQNTKSDDNVISDGSIIAVSEDQTAIVVSMGKITDIFAEPGEHVLHEGSPSLMGGSGAKAVGKDVVKRVGFGGDVPATTQRVYYVNRKEIVGNEFSAVVPIRVRDENIGLDMDATLEAAGIYSFKIVDPELIYKTLMGNVEGTYKTSWFTKQLNSEINACFMKYSSEFDFAEDGFRPSEIDEIVDKLAEKMAAHISEMLREKRGIEIVSLAFDKFRIDALDMLMISTMQANKVLTDPAMAAATLSNAQSEAMQSAANNPLFGNKE